MSLPPFDWVESPGTQVEERPRVRSAQFGDGYEQRAADGLNPIAQQWDLVFRKIDDAVASAIVAYLRTAGGVQAFSWTPLWSSTAIRVKCSSWRRTQSDEWGFSDLTARFEQVFEP